MLFRITKNLLHGAPQGSEIAINLVRFSTMLCGCQTDYIFQELDEIGFLDCAVVLLHLKGPRLTFQIPNQRQENVFEIAVLNLQLDGSPDMLTALVVEGVRNRFLSLVGKIHIFFVFFAERWGRVELVELNASFDILVGGVVGNCRLLA